MDNLTIPVLYLQAWDIQERGCPMFINGECGYEECEELCEVNIPDEIRELLDA